MPAGSKNKVNLGDMGLITIRFEKGSLEESLKIRCQVMHVTGNGIGLSIRLTELSPKEQDILGQITASGKAKIEND